LVDAREHKTSLSHPLRIDAVSVPGTGGQIGMTICPGKQGRSLYGPPWKRDLRLDVQAVQAWRPDLVVTLMEPEELAELRVAELGLELERAGIRWLHFPIPDLEAPGPLFAELWSARGAEVWGILRAGGRVLLHCRGGLGRTGTVAAQLLVELGEEPEAAMRTVREARPGAIETASQEAYVRRLGAGRPPAR